MIRQYFVLCIFSISNEAEELTCSFASEHVTLGTDLKISCSVWNSTSCLKSMNDRIWTRGKSKTAIAMNGYPRDKKGKYREEEVTCMKTTLVVMNFTESDLHVTYGLSVNMLQSNITASPEAINFEYLPQETDIEKLLNVTSTPMVVYTKIKKVFPMPNCSCLQDNEFVPWNMITTDKSEWFYSGKCVLTETNSHKAGPTNVFVRCQIGDKTVVIVNETVGNATGDDSNFTDRDAENTFFSVYSNYILGLLLLCACALVIFWSLRRNMNEWLELPKELRKRSILDWRRTFFAFILILVSLVCGWMTAIEIIKSFISKRIISYTRNVFVGALVTLLVSTPLDLCFISNPKTISIREGFKKAGKNGLRRVDKLLKSILCVTRNYSNPKYAIVSRTQPEQVA